MRAVRTPVVPGTWSRKRWMVLTVVAVLVLGGYAAGLAWVSRRLEVDMQKSFRAVPAAESGQRVE